KTPMNLSGLNASTDTVTLNFTTWFTLGLGDSIYVEARNATSNWTAIDSRTGMNSTEWETWNLNLSQYISNATVYLRFRFVSDDDDDGWIYNGWYIDNISVYNDTGISIAPLSFDDCSGFTNWNRIMLETSKWHITDYDAHSENNSWYCGVESTPHYLNCMDDVLVTRQIDLTGYSGYQAMLMFWHMYDMSDGDDNCTVEISTDNSTWTELAKYTGSRNWVQEFINISDYIGQQVWIRFRFQSDYSDTDTGWFVDDVLVEIRNITETTFEDDFELYYASPGIPRFPPTGPLNEIGGDWTVTGNFTGQLWYGWDQYGTVVNGRALLEGYLYSGAQDEWLISPVIPDLPKFSNLTFRHRLGIDTADVSAGIYMKLDGGNWTLLRVLSDTGGSYVTEDVSLWDYHGHDIQLAFVWQTNGNCSYDDRWMIDWVNVSSFGFLRVCAPVYINATDLPDNECRVGTSAIYWRYVYEGTHYPGESGDGYSRGEIVYGNEIPGTPDWAIGEYWWRIPDNSQWDLDNRTGYISAEIHFYEDCIHELYYFAKDHVCHSSELHYERWYVDGTAPETVLGISWGDHPWIPKNPDGNIRVGIYNSSEWPAKHYASYWTGGENNIYSEVQDILNSDAEGRFDVQVVTTLNYSTIREFDVLVLPDNAIPDQWLDDVDAWFIEGRRIVAIDSAVCAIAYQGYLWEDSKGSNGEYTFWDYNSGYDNQRIVDSHPIVKDYTAGQVITSVSDDAQMYKDMLPPDAVVLSENASNTSNAYVVYRQLPQPGRGSIVVLGPFETLDSYY
ncbi:MAG: hypothetical protein DRI52_10510, partial [Chloroflexi bacterium]